MYFLLDILWLTRTSKYVLFWLYLWQLKEYHIGRLFDHFRTYKGKKIFLNYLILAKLVLLPLIYFTPVNSKFFPQVFLIFFGIYFGESIIFIKQIIDKVAKKPVLTMKSLMLGFVSFVVILAVLIWSANRNITWLLIFDLFTPIIISVIVLIFQPFFVLLRNQIIKKAKKKLEAYSDLKVIVITGSYGKTSTKEALVTILKKKFNVLSTKEHQNSEIGIANCILNDLNVNHEIFIAEVGAYNKGKVREVCSMLNPKLGIVTGVNEQHMSLFGSMENLLSAEGGGELADILLNNNGTLVLNGDNHYCLDLYKKFDGKKLLYAESNEKLNADIWTESVSVYKYFISFIAKNKKNEMNEFKANILGKHNVQNLLGAILVAQHLGLNFGEISDQLMRLKQNQAGMILMDGKNGYKVIDSSYSSNPDGVYADLEYLSIFEQKKVVVMPCLIELGKKSKYLHEQIGKKIGKVCDLAIITTKENFESIKKGAMESGMRESNIILSEKSDEIYTLLTLFCKSGDAVLLEGRVPQKVVELLK